MDYEQEKKQIIEKHGEPVFELGNPVNESAKLLRALRNQKIQESRKTGMKQGRPTSVPNLGSVEATEIAKQVRKHLNQVTPRSLPAMEVEDKDIRMFNENEQNLIRDHFREPELSNKDLAKKHQVSYQFVTALMNTPSVKLLEAKVTDRLFPWETRMSILHGLRSNLPQITLRMAEHLNIISSSKTELNITNKPIEDPETIKMLRELGDKAANQKPNQTSQ